MSQTWWLVQYHYEKYSTVSCAKQSVYWSNLLLACGPPYRGAWEYQLKPQLERAIAFAVTIEPHVIFALWHLQHCINLAEALFIHLFNNISIDVTRYITPAILRKILKIHMGSPLLPYFILPSLTHPSFPYTFSPLLPFFTSPSPACTVHPTRSPISRSPLF